MNNLSRTDFFERLSNSVNIAPERKKVLQPLIDYITGQQLSNQPTLLNFICTHNSRRSHIAQLMAAAAADHADLENIHCFSGGVEVTRIHPNAKAALEQIGFIFSGAEIGDNPRFLVDLGEAHLIEVFSKTYDDDENPQDHFAAVMVCSDAESNCPFVAGAERRFSITYRDPKEFDPLTDPMPGYLERCEEIGAEMLYVMHSVSKQIQ